MGSSSLWGEWIPGKAAAYTQASIAAMWGHADLFDKASSRTSHALVSVQASYHCFTKRPWPWVCIWQHRQAQGSICRLLQATPQHHLSCQCNRGGTQGRGAPESYSTKPHLPPLTARHAQFHRPAAHPLTAGPPSTPQCGPPCRQFSAAPGIRKLKLDSLPSMGSTAWTQQQQQQ